MSESMRILAALMRGQQPVWPAEIDSAELARAADAHGATPLIAWQLRRNSELPVPPDFAAAIHECARPLTTLDIIRRHQVDGLIERFANARLPVLLIKGAALARTHYAHPALRPRCDVDLLVPEENGPRVLEVLRSEGFTEERNSGGVVISKQRTWVRVDAVGVRHCIDLHWALSNRQRYAEVFSFDELWSRGVTLRGDVRMTSPADALLIAAMHLDGHHHGSERLIWLYDIHLLHASMSADELHAMALLARERKVDFALDSAIALALRWFGDGSAVTHAPQQRSAAAELIDDLRHTQGLRTKLRLLREHLLPPASYVLQKYETQNRAALPALYLRRAIAGSARLFFRR